MTSLPSLESLRQSYQPKHPSSLQGSPIAVRTEPPAAVDPGIKRFLPATFDLPAVAFSGGGQASSGSRLRVGVVLSGGPAPGGHNAIAGLFDALKKIHPESSLFGFRNGPSGILSNSGREIDGPLIDGYRNSGGFDIIGTGRTKLTSRENFETVLETAKARELDGLVVIGGDDSNTNACMLAEFAIQAGSPLKVIGVPKTIDGDLKGAQIETSFGFDTACKLYSELIGNIHRDVLSARKYWHFIKLMGRSASHIALECALQTQPTLAFISEEIGQRKLALHDIVNQIANAISLRSSQGENFGTVIIPEGLIEFIPEIRVLISELNEVLAARMQDFEALETLPHKREFVAGHLPAASAGLYRHLPREIANQLFMDRDPHGNVQVARIDTERLLIELVEHRLTELKKDGLYKGGFTPLNHYFGYEGRCSAPSNFDADYTYSLGLAAAMLLREGVTGCIVSIRNLARPAEEWEAGGTPLSRMMHLERRHGEDTPVIRKALVDLDGPVFGRFAKVRDSWVGKTDFRFPGPIQYFGPPEISDRRTLTLELETAS